MTPPKEGRSLTWVSRVAVDTIAAWAQAAAYARRSLLPPPPFRPPGENHLLLLARPFPPLVSGGVYRPLGLVRAAVGRGWHVSVITQSAGSETSPASRELAAAVPPSVDVRRFDDSVARPSTNFAPGVDGGFSSIATIVKSAEEVLAKRPVSVIVASGPTFAEFVAGMLLRQSYGTPLILDYRDEWTESALGFVSRGRTDRWWERVCSKAATHLVFVTQTIADHHREVFDSQVETTSVIPNGWEDYLFQIGAPPVPLSDGSRTVIGFFGVLSEHWDLDEFLVTLSQAIDTRPSLQQGLTFRFVGRKADREREALSRFPINGLLEDIGHLPHAQAQLMMRECDALLTFNSPRLARCIGGKCYEYVAAGVPILLYGRGGEMEAYLSQHSGTRMVGRGDPAALDQVLRSLVSGEVRAEINDNTDRATSERRSLRSDQYVDLLEKTVNEWATNAAP